MQAALALTTIKTNLLHSGLYPSFQNTNPWNLKRKREVTFTSYCGTLISRSAKWNHYTAPRSAQSTKNLIFLSLLSMRMYCLQRLHLILINSSNSCTPYVYKIIASLYSPRKRESPRKLPPATGFPLSISAPTATLIFKGAEYHFPMTFSRLLFCFSRKLLP